MELSLTPLATNELLESGTYIVLVNITQPPPHLVLLNDGLCYGLHQTGKQSGEPAAAFLRHLRRRSLPSIFVNWQLPSPHHAAAALQQIMAVYTRVEVGKTSCLVPIRRLAEEQGLPVAAQCKFIFELLPLLQSAGQLHECYSLNYSEKTFELPVYSAADVDAAIARAAQTSAIG